MCFFILLSKSLCLDASLNTVVLVKQVGMRPSHFQHSRGGHSAFFSNLSAKELTEQVM